MEQYLEASAAVTHIGWPLDAARKPKPAKECASPTRKRNFQKCPTRGKKGKRMKCYKKTLEKAATKTQLWL